MNIICNPNQELNVIMLFVFGKLILNLTLQDSLKLGHRPG